MERRKLERIARDAIVYVPGDVRLEFVVGSLRRGERGPVAIERAAALLRGYGEGHVDLVKGPGEGARVAVAGLSEELVVVISCG